MKVSDKQEAIVLLSSLIGSSPKEIIRCLKFSYYREVPKVEEGEKPGEVKIRILHVPDENLMSLQSSILKRVLYQLPVSPAAHCAVPHRSPETNVKVHLEGKSWFKVDFKDAFPSVSREMVVRHLTPLLKGCYSLSFEEEIEKLAVLLSFLTTYKNALPQGTPTSSALMNLVCYELDSKLLKIAKEFELNYTRYSDDLIFSTPWPKIAKEARVTITETVKEYGFKINRKKTKYRTGKATVPIITGITLVPGEETVKPSIPRKKMEEYRRRIYVACSNPDIEVKKIFGIMGWVRIATGGEIPPRLRKPFRQFLEKRCPKRLPRYARLLK